MLSLTKPLSVTPALRITVNAAQNITGLGVNPLDGDGDNIPGGQYVALIGRSFSYKDQTGGIVSLAVARVGMLELRNGPEGNWHHHLRIVNAVAKRSVLFERGRRLGPGVDGITTLQSITGS